MVNHCFQRVDAEAASGLIKFFAGSCLSELGIVLKESQSIYRFKRKLLLKHRKVLITRTGSFITSPYSQVLSAKNLIKPQAAVFLMQYKSWEVFLNCRCMECLFLNRMNSWQGFVKKEQETIIIISIDDMHYFAL
jgi:hypothetical protein